MASKDLSVFASDGSFEASTPEHRSQANHQLVALQHDGQPPVSVPALSSESSVHPVLPTMSTAVSYGTAPIGMAMMTVMYGRDGVRQAAQAGAQQGLCVAAKRSGTQNDPTSPSGTKVVLGVG